MPGRFQRDHRRRILLQGLHGVSAPVDTKVNVAVDHSRRIHRPSRSMTSWPFFLEGRGPLPTSTIRFFSTTTKPPCLGIAAAVDDPCIVKMKLIVVSSLSFRLIRGIESSFSWTLVLPSFNDLGKGPEVVDQSSPEPCFFSLNQGFVVFLQ